MKTIALRFGDHFAPPPGTIELHKQLINKNGFVWYGKLGSPISKSVKEEIFKNVEKKILLIHSGTSKRYWAYLDEIADLVPNKEEYPTYYADKSEKMKTWFRIIKIEDAPNNVMSKCIVTSSGLRLSDVSKHSMSPYFIIDLKEDN